MQLQLYGKQIWIFKKPVDFRKSLDGLSQLVSEIKGDLREGIYLFYNKNKDKVKCLSWHKNGFILFYKRLEKGRFCVEFKKTEGTAEMKVTELGWLLAGLEWQKMRHWQELDYQKFS